jgi:hypothetical protein
MNEDQDQILHTAKCKIVASLFTRDVMAQTSDDCKCLVKQAIMNAVPQFCSLNSKYIFNPSATILLNCSIASFNLVVNKAQCQVVSQALTSACGKVINIAHSGVPHAYELYHPSHHTTELSPVQYRVHVATTLTQSLAFMHSHHFDAVHTTIFSAMKY